MRKVTSCLLPALLLTGTVVTAQDATVTRETKVKADNGKVVTMTGCVMIGGATNFLLSNVTSAHEKRDKGTSPDGGSYALIEREGLDLGPFINQRVELTGVVVPAATRNDKDDKIEIKETAKVDVEHGPDRKSSAATTVRVARGTTSQFLVASVKTLAPACEQ